MPSPVNLSRSPRSARRLHDLRPRFRVELLCKLHRALHVGEHHGDLLRSPSRADLDCRIFSARCRGVYSRGARKGGVRSATFALHSRQNFAAGGSSVPRPGQREAKAAPHSRSGSRNRTSRRSCQSGNFTWPSATRPTTSIEAAVGTSLRHTDGELPDVNGRCAPPSGLEPAAWIAIESRPALA